MQNNNKTTQNNSQPTNQAKHKCSGCDYHFTRLKSDVWRSSVWIHLKFLLKVNSMNMHCQMTILCPTFLSFVVWIPPKVPEFIAQWQLRSQTILKHHKHFTVSFSELLNTPKTTKGVVTEQTKFLCKACLEELVLLSA